MDSRRIERILRNLVSNAIEHGEGRPIEITLGSNDSAVAVTVRDHGVGLRPGEAALVFTRFWRADPARARTTGGTGLGLAISLEDARLHAGRLEAWGALGEGSCFRLILPRQADATITGSPLPLSPLLSRRPAPGRWVRARPARLVRPARRARPTRVPACAGALVRDGRAVRRRAVLGAAVATVLSLAACGRPAPDRPRHRRSASRGQRG